MKKSDISANLYKANDELLVLRERVRTLENENTMFESGQRYWEKRSELLEAKIGGYKEILEIIFYDADKRRD